MKKNIIWINKINDIFEVINEKEITIKIFIEQLEKEKNESKEKNNIKIEEINRKKETKAKIIKKAIEEKQKRI